MESLSVKTVHMKQEASHTHIIDFLVALDDFLDADALDSESEV